MDDSYLKLRPEDLDRLELDALNDRLPPTTGFHFGRSSGFHREETLRFIPLARGKILFYRGSW